MPRPYTARHFAAARSTVGANDYSPYTSRTTAASLMANTDNTTPSVGPRVWSLMRGRVDGELWAVNHAEPHELIAWADIADFEHYMGPMPFPYDNARAVEFYEAAKSDATTAGMPFTHREYAGGFLQSVYETLRSRLGLEP